VAISQVLKTADMVLVSEMGLVQALEKKIPDLIASAMGL
jgi:hypothetical protein